MVKLYIEKTKEKEKEKEKEKAKLGFSQKKPTRILN